jgi:hypothetical protein
MTVEQPENGPERPNITFTLVHGTFAKGADWVEKEDPKMFRQNIRSELGDSFTIHFDSVNWGFNRWLCKLWDNTVSIDTVFTVNLL